VLLFVVAMETPLRILAVDNEPSVTLSLRYVFSDPHYELTCVNSGSAALSRLDANSDLYDVIIVDEKMPHMTGVELVGTIRKRGIKGKIVVVSAHLNAAICEAYGRLGVQVLFSKPFNVDELRTAVDRIAA
jgi:two-component system response regulator (stage 0 sporulation protein F)